MQFSKVAGVGGIGTALLFISEQIETFKRSESRMVLLSDAKDYCKQQIVLHYVSVLTKGKACISPIGCVGNDATGELLIREMQNAGMDIRFIKKSDKNATTIGICLQYPDKEGFNFTVKNSASDEVSPEYVIACLEDLAIDSQTIAVVIPEVPVDSRLEMLRYCRKKGAFNALTIPVSEAEYFLAGKALELTDLLAVNREEAEALCGVTGDADFVAKELYRVLRHANDVAILMVTDGKNGIITAHNGNFEITQPQPVEVVNTTGAGDACLGGTLAGLIQGLPLQKGRNDKKFGETPLQSAVELGAVCAGMAIELNDTIVVDINLDRIREKIDRMGIRRIAWPIN